MKYCPQCGHEMDDQARFCPTCGKSVCPEDQTLPARPDVKDGEKEPRDWLVSLILCIFLGYLGIHSFYNGKIGVGIAQILTAGGCGIWTIIDLVMICTDQYKDAEGRKLVHKI